MRNRIEALQKENDNQETKKKSVKVLKFCV